MDTITIIKSAIKEAHIDAMINGWLPDERVELHTAGKLSTAYWQFKPPHKVVIGESILKNLLFPEEPSNSYYVASFVYHEIAHARWTDRDIANINKCCDAQAVPFKLYNLFEDARIEHLWRKDTSRDFLWSDYEEYSVTKIFSKRTERTPEELFFLIVQHEKERLSSKLEKHPEYEIVNEFYERTIEAPDSIAVIDICADWLKKYPSAEKDMENSALFNSFAKGTPQNIIMLCEESGTSSLVIGNSDTEGGKKADNKKAAPVPYKTAHDKLLSGGDISVLFKGKRAVIDEKRVANISRVFERILKKGQERVNTSTPQKRLNTRAFAIGGDKLFRKDMKGDTRQGKKSFTVIVDCSGSMDGTPLEEGRVLLSVLNNLARADKIECNIVLSATNDRHICGTYHLPVDNELFARLGTANSEGFATTIEKTMPLLQKADYVFVYTDGCIGDQPQKDYAHKHGVYTYGLYAGERNMADELLKFFDCAISRSSIEEIINALIAKIK